MFVHKSDTYTLIIPTKYEFPMLMISKDFTASVDTIYY